MSPSSSGCPFLCAFCELCCALARLCAQYEVWSPRASFDRHRTLFPSSSSYRLADSTVRSALLRSGQDSCQSASCMQLGYKCIFLLLFLFSVFFLLLPDRFPPTHRIVMPMGLYNWILRGLRSIIQHSEVHLMWYSRLLCYPRLSSTRPRRYTPHAFNSLGNVNAIKFIAATTSSIVDGYSSSSDWYPLSRFELLQIAYFVSPFRVESMKNLKSYTCGKTATLVRTPLRTFHYTRYGLDVLYNTVV